MQHSSVDAVWHSDTACSGKLARFTSELDSARVRPHVGIVIGQLSRPSRNKPDFLGDPLLTEEEPR